MSNVVSLLEDSITYDVIHRCNKFAKWKSTDYTLTNYDDAISHALHTQIEEGLVNVGLRNVATGQVVWSTEE